jgi:triosephosphate isomerase
VAAALDHGLTPLVCVGEPLSVRQAGAAESFIAGQVRAALGHIGPADTGRVLLAYEPIWAIGEAGRPARVEEVAPVLRRIVDTVAALTTGGRLRALLYGGSVNLDNAAELLADPGTDGLFVGRAAWQPDGFRALIEIAAGATR